MEAAFLFPIKSGFSVTTTVPYISSGFQCIWCMHGWEFDPPKEKFSLCPDSRGVTSESLVFPE